MNFLSIVDKSNRTIGNDHVESWPLSKSFVDVLTNTITGVTVLPRVSLIATVTARRIPIGNRAIGVLVLVPMDVNAFEY